MRKLLGNRASRGFTLIEAALVTAIIGIGVLAMLQLLAAGTVSNNNGMELTTGLTLAKNVREMAIGMQFCDPTEPTHWGAETGETLLTYDDLDDFDGKSFSPPIDARRQVLANYQNWSQNIVVKSVDEDSLTNELVGNGTTPAIKFTCTITHNGKYVCDISWYTFDQTVAP